jgi:hypothetical protein
MGRANDPSMLRYLSMKSVRANKMNPYTPD